MAKKVTVVMPKKKPVTASDLEVKSSKKKKDKDAGWSLAALTSMLSEQAKKNAARDEKEIEFLEKEIQVRKRNVRSLHPDVLMVGLMNLRHGHSHPRIHELRQELFGVLLEEIKRRLALQWDKTS